MSTVIGIFENHFKKKNHYQLSDQVLKHEDLHINDTINIVYLAWKKNLCRHYSIANKKSYSVNEVAKMFNSKIRYLPKRAGERYASALTNKNLSNKIYKYFGKIQLKDYISKFVSRKGH